MPSINHNLNIVKNVQMIESLKAELVSELALLYHGMVVNQEEAISDALASLVIHIFSLGKRLGIPYDELGRIIDEKLQSDSDRLLESEELLELQQYFNSGK